MGAQGMGERRTRRKPLGADRGLGRQPRPAGGGEEGWAAEAGRVRKGTSYGKTTGSNTYLVVG